MPSQATLNYTELYTREVHTSDLHCAMCNTQGMTLLGPKKQNKPKMKQQDSSDLRVT